MSGRDPRLRAYLEELAARLDGTTRDNRRALSEIGAHLDDIAAAERAAGCGAEEAAARAIARVGSVDAVAGRFAAEVETVWPLRIGLRLGRVVLTWLFAMGLAGFLAEPIAWLVGRDFFVGDERFVAVTPARCLQLMKLHRAMPTCNAALMEDHFGELVQFGLVIAVAAALALWAFHAVVQRLDPLRGQARLDAWTARIGAALFLALALSSLARALRSIAADPQNGGGRHLVEGIVALVVAVAWGVASLRRQTRARAALTT
ncbi:MAG: hypothetical protein JWN44_6788 [Myxococcales bacterium]|nr:hypothetical protein [Myxococcales bacterium]